MAAGGGRTTPRRRASGGIRDKLVAYCLNLDHEIGGAKARGFLEIFGIGRDDAENLAQAVQDGVIDAPVTEARARLTRRPRRCRSCSSLDADGVGAAVAASAGGAQIDVDELQLGPGHVSTGHGAPLRLRHEIELGFKEVRWIRGIEFVADVAEVAGGYGGYNLGHAFYGYRQSI